jgi:hypothetical protein
MSQFIAAPIMKKQVVVLLTMGVLLMLTLTPAAIAANVEITWTEPGKYRDIHPGTQTRKRFRDNLFSNLEKHFAKLAVKLPKQQTLMIDVTDIDLAGDVNHGGIDRIRIVKPHYIPRLTFSYQLLDANNSLISEASVNIKDMNFMQSRSLRYRGGALADEKKLLDDWFKDTFSSLQLIVAETDNKK